ncbi:MAG: hypothetical protein AAGA54_00495 [Myxococcota bacterium]
MKSWMVGAAVVALTLAGLVVAVWPSEPSSPDPARGTDGTRARKGPRRASGDHRFSADDRAAKRAGLGEANRARRRTAFRRRDEAPAAVADEAVAPAAAIDPEEHARVQEALTACVEERVELLGEPIEQRGTPEARFTSAALSTGVSSALDQSGVAGSVEATDCSEHPCIVFGRLEGDEADMEKVERAEALHAYDGDVLSLLFWATSVDDPAAPARETGLFALAYFTDADRQEFGEALDRRIRARVMEYWNTDAPGQPADAAGATHGADPE